MDWEEEPFCSTQCNNENSLTELKIAFMEDSNNDLHNGFEVDINDENERILCFDSKLHSLTRENYVRTLLTLAENYEETIVWFR